jgi:hypothetical protein
LDTGLPDGFFKSKIPFWVNFLGACTGRGWFILWPFWYILQPFVIFYDHLVYFLVIWYVFPVLVCFNKKNLATLLG